MYLFEYSLWVDIKMDLFAVIMGFLHVKRQNFTLKNDIAICLECVLLLFNRNKMPLYELSFKNNFCNSKVIFEIKIFTQKNFWLFLNYNNVQLSWHWIKKFQFRTSLLLYRGSMMFWCIILTNSDEIRQLFAPSCRTRYYNHCHLVTFYPKHNLNHCFNIGSNEFYIEYAPFATPSKCILRNFKSLTSFKNFTDYSYMVINIIFFNIKRIKIKFTQISS